MKKKRIHPHLIKDRKHIPAEHIIKVKVKTNTIPTEASLLALYGSKVSACTADVLPETVVTAAAVEPSRKSNTRNFRPEVLQTTAEG